MCRWLFLLFPFFLHAEISALYLSWFDDPSTTMAIQWHTPPEEFGDTLYLSDANGHWIPFSGSHCSLEHILIHKVALSSLTPNTEYAFKIGETSEIYRFRTAPKHLEEPLRFLIGGNVYASPKLFRKMSQVALEQRPHFAVLGGDLAYAIQVSPFRSPLKRWLSFLRDWKNCMTDAEGRILPFLLVPGNHDISPSNYKLFFTLFAFPQKQLYRTVDFGNYLSLFLLDTGHFHPIEGQQTTWLEKSLSARTSIPYRFAIYHEAAYPSSPQPETSSLKIRHQWVPLFEKYQLLAAFENHTPTFKRTYPLKGGQIDPTGIIYFGDGSWGASLPRTAYDLWYLAKKSRKNSLLVIELTPKEASVQAIDLLNHSLDRTTFPQS